MSEAWEHDLVCEAIEDAFGGHTTVTWVEAVFPDGLAVLAVATPGGSCCVSVSPDWTCEDLVDFAAEIANACLESIVMGGPSS